MNIMMPYLNWLALQGIQGPPVTLDKFQLSKINVTMPGQEAGVGMLKEAANLNWPFVLRGPTQQKLAVQIPAAVTAAANGSLQPKAYYDIRKGIDQLNNELSQRFRKEKIDGAAYLTGKRFLEPLENSIKMLEQPQAPQLLTGAYAARGRTVPELVQNMTKQGLQFAPAAPGTEQAYHALYYAMASYAAAGQNSSGFRSQVGETMPAQPTPPEEERDFFAATSSASKGGIGSCWRCGLPE